MNLIIGTNINIKTYKHPRKTNPFIPMKQTSAKYFNVLELYSPSNVARFEKL